MFRSTFEEKALMLNFQVLGNQCSKQKGIVIPKFTGVQTLECFLKRHNPKKFSLKKQKKLKVPLLALLFLLSSFRQITLIYKTKHTKIIQQQQNTQKQNIQK